MRILGYFPDLKSANEAFKVLKAEGVGKAYVDANNTNNQDIVNSFPGTSFRSSVSEPSSNSPTFTDSTTAGKEQGDGLKNNSNNNYAVVVETDETSLEQVKNIISQMGGVIKE